MNTTRKNITRKTTLRRRCRQKYQLLVLPVVFFAVGLLFWLSTVWVGMALKSTRTSIEEEALQSQHDRLIRVGGVSVGRLAKPSSTAANVNNGGIKPTAKDIECKKRNMMPYKKQRYTPWKTKGKTHKEIWSHCLVFKCLKDEAKCDNIDPTNFDSPEPPCCTHLLRDMAREFDRVMCYLGLEYIPAYGMLLGLVRGDRVIPWTSDNDYLISTDTLMAMQELWDSASHLNHGLGFHMDSFHRLCITPSFVNGKLTRWKTPVDDGIPYADIFHGTVDERASKFRDSRGCTHSLSAVYPTVRKPVYNGTFYLQYPSRPVEVVSDVFGPNWNIPDNKKEGSSKTNCLRK